MQLTPATTQHFLTHGYAHVDDVITPQRAAQVSHAIDDIYNGWSDKTNGITSYCHHPGLFDLYQEPNLERLAQNLLGTPHVILSSASILYKRPQPNTPFRLDQEHVDVMYTLDDWTHTPRRIMCILIIAIDDLPVGRGNTYIRPGSHLQLAHWLKENNQQPTRAHPVAMPKLPLLPWADPIPVTATQGQAVAFSTNVLHSGSTNTDTHDRRIIFVNFCCRGDLRTRVANHDRRQVRTAWRNHLRTAFRPDRQHLLDDHED